jgi:alkylation response protein AidB-like acyl-CoA dehydrogenase
MDFTFTEEEEAIITVARRLFEERATPDHLTALEARATRFDEALWKELAEAGLLGIAVPEDLGGSGRGFLGICVLLAQVGWSVAPVPAYATLVLGAEPITLFGTPEQRKRYLPGVVAGTQLLTAGLMEPGRSDPGAPATTATRDGSSWRLHGAKELVPAAQIAHSVLVPAATRDGGVGLFLLDTATPGVEVKPIATTNREPHADLVIDGARVPAENRLGDGGCGVEAVRTLHAQALVGLCAIQLGVVERALRIAADYTAGREQFGRPIGSFQAVQQRMADAFIDVEVIRWTTWYAAWLLEMGRPASREASIAKFWAAEAGARVAATAQQVHGGIGIDMSYPLFRYFLWAKQNELALGSAPEHLARLGAGYAEENHR